MAVKAFEREPKPGTPESDRFDLLAPVLEDYEKKRWPTEPTDPNDAIRYRMETGNFSQADLDRLVGSRQPASDVLKRKRRLTMQMAWTLHRKPDIPAGAMIRPPPRRAATLERMLALARGGMIASNNAMTHDERRCCAGRTAPSQGNELRLTRGDWDGECSRFSPR